MSFAETVRRFRSDRGLTQEALGSAVGVSGQAVSKWETADAMPDPTLLPALADALGVTIDALFGHEKRTKEKLADEIRDYLGGFGGGEADRELFDLLAAAFLGVAIGFFLSSFSPGHAARSALVAERTPYTASIVFRIARTFFHGCRHSLVPLGLTGFFVVLNRSRRSWLELDELFFIFLAFVNVAVMAMPNGYSPRTVLLSSLLLVIALARSGLRLVSESPACQQARPQLRKALWVLILFLTLYALLQVSIGVLMHYRQGTTFERETLYFLVKYDIFK